MAIAAVPAKVRRPKKWSVLQCHAKLLRVEHAAIAAVEMSSLVYVWTCAVTGRRDRVLGAAVAALALQGGAIILGRGNCPIGPIQAQVGDPTPFFELIFPPRLAKMVFPLLLPVTIAGVALVAGRAVWDTKRN